MEQRRICPYCMQELEAGEEQCPHCGRELAGRNPSGSLPAGTVLAGRYTVGDIQSVDGEGILYRGVENNGPFRVTIKEYMPLTLAAERGRDCILRPKPGSEVLFKTTRMDFADLYRFIQRITPANGLEAVLDVFEENNTVYAVMENPGGCPLQKWLEEHGTVTPQQACAMLEPVFNGVEAMHQVGLVHRGICPANIRIMDNGRARLTGYATVGLRTAGSGLHEQLYEGYSAPEQYSTAEFEGRYTDEYSLAAVFYRMVCGLSPVPAAQRLGDAVSGPPAQAGGAHPDGAAAFPRPLGAGVCGGVVPQHGGAGPARPRAAGAESAREGGAAERPKSSGGHRHSAQRPRPADPLGSAEPSEREAAGSDRSGVRQRGGE